MASTVAAVTAGVCVEQRPGGLLAATFSAMASPCEVLVETRDRGLAQRLGGIAAAEAWRVEARYSRYRPDSILSRLNASHGAPVTVDAETAALLEFARQCHADSNGAFDITSGVLRRAWRFDGGNQVPTPAILDPLLRLVGFGRIDWRPPQLVLPEGMELDFGGIGKEYAVDRALGLVATAHPGPVLVNFGGDLACRGVPADGAWRVGVERPMAHGAASLLLELSSTGALATSGDTHRYVMHEGRRLGHILDPRTGWPVEGGPASVTVAAATCIEAGTLATLALLQGNGATDFLNEEGVRFWCR